MSSSDRDRMPPASSATTTWMPGSTNAQPLARDTREKFESGFGHDFSAVRVHADSASAAQARRIGAQAFTIGHDVHFAAGRYEPHSERGRDLLAHELAHVVQQAQGGATSDAEQRADAAAARVGRGHRVSPSMLGGAPAVVQAKPDESTAPAVAPVKTDPNQWSENIDRFGHNSATLTGKQNKAVTALAAAIAARLGIVANGRATITITGGTDTSGDEKYNSDLGQQRADAVKAVLEAALAKQNLGSGRIGSIDTASTGERDLAKPTKDDVREPLNRRVVITAKIEAPPVVVSPGPLPSEGGKAPDLTLPPDYKPPEEHGPRRPPGENWWDKAEENQRKIDEYDRKHPRKPKSVTDVIVEGVTEALEPIIKKLPQSLRKKAREGIRKGIEKGTEAGCDAAIDAAGVSGEEAEAIKAACKAGLKSKPGGGGESK